MKLVLLLLIGCLSSGFIRAQCPTGTTPSGIEAVTNGDFSGGNTGFTSAYFYTAHNVTEGEYWVATGAQVPTWNGGMTSNGDHTTGSGNFMLVNGSPAAGTNIWCQTITVTPNTTYLFSAWISTLYPSSPAIVQFSINGTVIGSPISAPATTGTWIPFNTSWFSGTNTTATICIVNQNTSIGGNDFGLDDISFRPCLCSFVANAGNDAGVCDGGTVTLNAAAADSYSWSPVGSLSCTTCQSPVASPTVTTTYTLQSTVNGCSSNDNVVVQVFPPASANAGSDITLCAGVSGNLGATGGVSYTWLPATGLSNTAVANPSVTIGSTTTYTVVVTDANGCTGQDDVVVNLQPEGNYTAGPDTSLCAAHSVQLLAGGATQYSWAPAAGLSNPAVANPIATPSGNTTYTVTLTDASGCTAERQVVVNVHPDFNIAVSSDTTVCRLKLVTLRASGGVTYLWTPKDFLSCTDCPSVTLNPERTILYTVRVTDANGCEKLEMVTVNVKGDCALVTMPSAFSPNGSGKNDFLAPLGNGIQQVSWRIYNRWGEKIFEANDVTDKWDGKFNGLDEPVGVYVWYLEAQMVTGDKVQEKGNVTLLR